jgi:hypothetical protein
MVILFAFINYIFLKMFSPKKITLKTGDAASREGEGNLTYFMYFSWPPLEAGLSLPTFRFLLNTLTAELNPSAQRCLTRFFTGDFAS